MGNPKNFQIYFWKKGSVMKLCAVSNRQVTVYIRWTLVPSNGILGEMFKNTMAGTRLWKIQPMNPQTLPNITKHWATRLSWIPCPLFIRVATTGVDWGTLSDCTQRGYQYHTWLLRVICLQNKHISWPSREDNPPCAPVSLLGHAVCTCGLAGDIPRQGRGEYGGIAYPPGID